AKSETLLVIDWVLPFVAAGLAAAMLIRALHAGVAGHASWPFWAAVVAVWLTGWRIVTLLAAARPSTGFGRALVSLGVPAVFGLTILFLWEVGARGAGVPPVILPPPGAIIARLTSSVPTLAVDFVQTFKGVAAGFVIGCGAGFLVAILIDRVPF